ncbi:NfeD family protein [Ketogulonicigenium vulgare]|uniref:NfeD-like C-terminal domain-containing protein n=1 Tax=Ketogulonicigenium vulgare (strain WSH-001) TaxID=759362 RepID=F9Y711_KETVW|nr:hypothetical protein [Ketogulonicigenium vulgare]ADO41206.1 conserved hypothetical protein [Ketogulonicigenium vulgare Y25]AEM42201.1 hypothetical protein KVU_2363 [Ketogulonicigenium vulgare WSH-001]ALJ79824.1 hypothetical protein KVH_00600 [Ketogulonicigenium vulgare]ANW34818.1 hypothetical protein KvSKV_00610 [Ketogulonicigenium vulgare]AOZ53036.1 hypothetical protein KVC_0009 [Ketogulonicigenium vulgare]
MTALMTVWWAWVCAGVVFAIIEVVVPAFIFLGFAIGAVLTGIVVLLGLTSVPWLLLMFALFSLAAYIALRLAFGARKGERRTFRDDINDNRR